jgi:hypothetical protein
MVLLALTPLSAQEIKVRVDGNPVNFANQTPVIENSRVLIPLRGVFEKMGATVVWDPDQKTVTARRNGDRVRLKIGSRTSTVNGVTHTLDTAPQVLDGRTMVPIRFISESLQAQVEWKAEEKLVLVSSGGGDNLQPDPEPRDGKSFTGILKKAQPSIFMQGSHQLEDQNGNLKVLLTAGDSGVDLDHYLGDRVQVEGKAEPTVEGNMTLLRVEKVKKL